MKYKINFNICGSVYINNCNEDEAWEKAADIINEATINCPIAETYEIEDIEEV